MAARPAGRVPDVRRPHPAGRHGRQVPGHAQPEPDRGPDRSAGHLPADVELGRGIEARGTEMAIVEQPPEPRAPRSGDRHPGRRLGVFRRPVATTGWKSWLFTIDHKKIGIMYGGAALFFFVLGGIEALLIRLQLAQPDGKLLSADTYNQMFTMHAHDDGVPGHHADGRRLRQLPRPAADRRPRRGLPAPELLWLLGVLLRRGVPQPVVVHGRRPRRRLVRLCAQHRRRRSRPTHGMDFWVLGPADHRPRLADRAINLIVTVLEHAGAGHDAHAHADLHLDVAGRPVPAAVRHPGHHGGAVLLHVRRALRGELLQRGREGPTRCCGSTCSGSSATRRSTSSILPSFGIVSEVLPVLRRKPLFGYPFVVFSGIAMASWAGACGPTTCSPPASGPSRWPLLALDDVHRRATGVKIFNWIATMWGGRIRFTASMLFAIGLVVEFTIGGLSGVTHAIRRPTPSRPTPTTSSPTSTTCCSAARSSASSPASTTGGRSLRPVAQREVGQVELLADGHRNQPDLRPDAHRRAGGPVPPQLPGDPRMGVSSVG